MKQKKKNNRTESTLEKIERDNKERRQTKGQQRTKTNKGTIKNEDKQRDNKERRQTKGQ